MISKRIVATVTLILSFIYLIFLVLMVIMGAWLQFVILLLSTISMIINAIDILSE